MSLVRTVVHRPLTVGEAVQALAATPGTALLAGGTDLVPALRDGTRRPRAIVALRRVVELKVRGASPDMLTIGAGVTCRALAGWELAAGLAHAASVMGSPHIRNTATVGGALGTASPTGDLITFLVAAGAEVLLAGPAGRRRVPIAEFLAGDGRTDELVTAVEVPRPAGPQAYFKVGGRQAAYAAVVSCALVLDRARHRLSCAFGGLTAVPRSVAEAERFAAAEIDWSTPAGGPAVDQVARRFGATVAQAAAASADLLPDGPRVATSYRVHAAGVLAGRALVRCLAEPFQPFEPRPSDGGLA